MEKNYTENKMNELKKRRSLYKWILGGSVVAIGILNAFYNPSKKNLENFSGENQKENQFSEYVNADAHQSIKQSYENKGNIDLKSALTLALLAGVSLSSLGIIKTDSKMNDLEKDLGTN